MTGPLHLRLHRLLPLAAAALVGGCAARHAPSPTTTAPDATGRWDFSMNVGQRVSTGEVWLYRRGGDYTGTVTVRGTNALPVRSLTVRTPSAATAAAVAMTVDTPEGPVTFAGTLAPDGGAMQGTVTYHAGERFSFEARRRATP